MIFLLYLMYKGIDRKLYLTYNSINKFNKTIYFIKYFFYEHPNIANSY